MKITVEEIDILVQANIEGALKEFKKLIPEIKKQIGKAKQEFNNLDIKAKIDTVDMKQVSNEVQKVKKQIKETFNPNSTYGLKINGKSVIEYHKSLKEIEKQAEAIKDTNIRPNKIAHKPTIKSTDDNMELQNSVVNIQPSQKNLDIWDTLKLKIQQVKPVIQQFKQEIKNLNSNNAQIDYINQKIQDIKDTLATIDNGKGPEFDSSEILKMKAELEKLEEQKSRLETKGKNNIFASLLTNLRKLMSQLGNISNLTVKIKNQIKQWSSSLKGGLSQILKYAGALFSLQGIYSLLRGSANSWLSSQNAQAKQLSANIEYMKHALGSVFAGVIQYVTNLVYKLMKAVQSLVYAFTGVNIFAKATASSMKGASKSAKDTNKSLAGVHNEIDNVSDSKNSGGGGFASPSMDLSKIDSQMSPLAQKLYDFFKPLKESWDKYGADLIAQVKITASQVGYLISSVWGSFENIITNGTVYTTLELILAIIGNIAEAFANAWNYNGNGDAIIQSLANAFNNLLTAINNVAKSDKFQEFLNICSDKFRIIAEKIESINWQPMIDALFDMGSSIGVVALNVLTILVDIFKWFVEHPDVAIILVSIAGALLLIGSALRGISGLLEIYEMISGIAKILEVSVSTVISVVGGIVLVVMGAVTAISSFMSMLSEGFSWIKEIIMVVGIAITAVGAIILGVPALVAGVVAVIVAVVATLIVVIKEHWETIKQTTINIWNAVKDFLSSLWESIKEKAVTVFENVKNKIAEIFGNIKAKAIEIWNNIKSSISEKINNLKTNISTALSNISNTWNNVWTNLKTTVSNIWNSIWSTIKGIINKILGGIESFANGIVRGVNKVLSALDGVVTAVGSVIGVDIHVSPLNEISLPRLKTGGVLYEETQFVGGEYSGARNNPEIVSPVNLIYETQKRAIEDSNMNGQGGDTTYIFKIGNTTIAEICIDEFKRIKRQTGKDLEVICDG